MLKKDGSYDNGSTAISIKTTILTPDDDHIGQNRHVACKMVDPVTFANK
jgi:hypothetical protein